MSDITGYFIPLLSKFDINKETRWLARNLRTANVTEVRRCLEESHNKYRNLVFLGQIADTADRFTSVIGGTIETIASFFGVVPGFIANAGEEVIELLIKAPFLAYLTKDNHRDKVYGLMAREVATVALPVVGDVYDVLTNKYVSTAYDVIREDARNRLAQSLEKIVA